jgi:SAM-dependent methyltransferase
VPHYGELTARAAFGAFRASAGGLDVYLNFSSSSLLAQNMNVLWAGALNAARSGRRPDYFAMLHADIEPEPHWLDTLVGEMEEKGLDVLGVVAPIKDVRGVTSTALARPDGNTWRPHGRLTMREVYRLPETFTSDDVGYPLLLNTGCWVCRFDEAWARKVYFTVNDAIRFDPKKDIYFVQTESEDWFISRLFHELGLKVGATRKVPLGHRGGMVFGNTKPWGENEFDREYLTKSILDGDPDDWFPHQVAGWLSEAEGRELARLAEGKAVLEIGAYCGRSTICLAQKATSVGAVDPFDGRGTHLPGDTQPLFAANLKRHGVAGRVVAYRGTAAEFLPNFPPVFDLVFIDGAHDRQSVESDAALAAAVLRPGGLLVFHDYGRTEDPGVTEAVDGLLAGGAKLLSRLESLAVVRPAAAEILEPVGV